VFLDCVLPLVALIMGIIDDFVPRSGGLLATYQAGLELYAAFHNVAACNECEAHLQRNVQYEKGHREPDLCCAIVSMRTSGQRRLEQHEGVY